MIFLPKQIGAKSVFIQKICKKISFRNLSFLGTLRMTHIPTAPQNIKDLMMEKDKAPDLSSISISRIVQKTRHRKIIMRTHGFRSSK